MGLPAETNQPSSLAFAAQSDLIGRQFREFAGLPLLPWDTTAEAKGARFPVIRRAQTALRVAVLRRAAMVALLGLTIGVLLGCSPAPATPQVVPLETTTHAAPAILVVDTELDVLNPNAFALLAYNAQSDLTIGETIPVPSQSANLAATLPAHAHTRLHVKVGVTADDLAYPLPDADPIPFTLVGELWTRRLDGANASLERAHYVVHATLPHPDIKVLLSRGARDRMAY